MTFTGQGVAMAFIHPHDGPWGFVTSYARTLHEYPDLIDFDMGSGPRLPTARNQIVQAVLDDERRYKYVWLIDSDMAFPSDTLRRMWECVEENELPILGALCFCVARSGRIEPTIRRFMPDGGLETVWDFPENTLIKCDASGAACLLIHREVFERVYETHHDSPYPWFADSEVVDPKSGTRYEFGEDVTFLLRARQLGYPVHVHSGIEVGHIKPHVYGLEDYKRNRAEILEIGEDASRIKHYQNIGLLSKVEDATATRVDLIKPEPMNRAARRRLERARG